MTVRVLGGRDQTSAAAGQVVRLDEMARAICDAAAASAHAAMGAERRLAGSDAAVDQPGFTSHFWRALAAGVAQALAANDQRVLAVYACESAPAGDAPAEDAAEVLDPSAAPIHLLVLVTVPSAALEAFVASLDRTLGAGLNALPALRFSQAGPWLDISIVTEREVRQGLGMARLLAGSPLPPRKLWQRKG